MYDLKYDEQSIVQDRITSTQTRHTRRLCVNAETTAIYPSREKHTRLNEVTEREMFIYLGFPHCDKRKWTMSTGIWTW